MTKISTNPSAFRVRPAQPEEAGAFFAQTPEQDAQMGAIGHVRMDFGGSGKEFWHTWHPRGREELNSPKFKAELQQVVDKLRETVLKDFSSMRRFCYENGGKIPGGWSQNYGYVVETEHYEYCLRCNPVPGDYQAYLLLIVSVILVIWQPVLLMILPGIFALLWSKPMDKILLLYMSEKDKTPDGETDQWYVE